MNQKWSILNAPQGLEWFTSDDPVVRLNFKSASDYNFRGGWGSIGTEILLPLSPRHLMYTKIGEPSTLRRPTPSRYHARLIRRIIAEHSHRQIHSKSEDKKIPILRPRVVDRKLFQLENDQWKNWHEEQSRAEQDLS